MSAEAVGAGGSQPPTASLSTGGGQLDKAEGQAELARLRACPRGTATTTSLLDPPIRLVDGPSFAAQYEDIFLWECYDFPTAAQSPTIVDGGANIGLATIWWLARWPKARVVAFEPDPAVFEVLRWNTRFLEGAELYQVALGTGMAAAFWSEGTDAGRLIPADEVGADAITVVTTPLSEVLSRLGKVDMLKLDIEGAEMDVLEEAEDALGLVENIFVEYHSFVGKRQRLGDLLLLLQRQGFRYHMESTVRRTRPLCGVPVDRGIDLQCNIFASRVLGGARPVETSQP
jgi:FkbM family methyltransferase